MPGIESRFLLDTSAIFCITVGSSLDPEMSERFGELSIFRGQYAGAFSVTLLVGRFADQAALFGVLNYLHNLGIPILGVQRLFLEQV
jgi:hypothetical protein